MEKQGGSVSCGGRGSLESGEDGQSWRGWSRGSRSNYHGHPIGFWSRRSMIYSDIFSRSWNFQRW